MIREVAIRSLGALVIGAGIMISAGVLAPVAEVALVVASAQINARLGG